MRFDSLSELIHMGGHGSFVWTAYGITILILAFNVIRAWHLKRKFLLNEKRVIEREQARQAEPQSAE